MQESGQENGFYRKVNENTHPSPSPTETEKAIVADVLANFPANFRDMGGNGYAKAGLPGQEETEQNPISFCSGNISRRQLCGQGPRYCQCGARLEVYTLF